MYCFGYYYLTTHSKLSVFLGEAISWHPYSGKITMAECEPPMTEVTGFYRRIAAISFFLLNQTYTTTAAIEAVVKQANPGVHTG